MTSFSVNLQRRNALLLSEERVAEVEYALAQKEPIISISRRLKLHRDTIREIRAGKHPVQREGKRKVRCQGCGGKQCMPCRVCDARKLRPTAA